MQIRYSKCWWPVAAVAIASIAFVPVAVPAEGQVVNLSYPVAHQTDGWLILRGQLISPPYQVEIIGDEVTVNGFRLRHSVQAPDPDNEVANSNAALFEEQEKTFQAFWEVWRGWCEQEAVEAARQRALEFWRGSPLVLEAYFPNPQHPSTLAVLFSTDPDAQVIELQAPDSNQAPPGEARAHDLQRMAEDLRFTLNHGCLVIVQGEGYSYTTAPGEGDEVVEEIAKISSSIADETLRIQSIRQLVPDDTMARDITEHFSP